MNIFILGAVTLVVSFLAVSEIQAAEEESGELEFVTYYMCLLNRGPNWTAEETLELGKLQQSHVTYLSNLMATEKIVLAGPFTDADDTRGVAVYRVDSLKTAKELGENDPKVLAGHLVLKWYTWMVPKGVLPTIPNEG